MKTQKIYIDTSVFGGYFDEEFEEYTRLLFERIYDGDFTVIYSDVTERELVYAPLQVKELASGLPQSCVDYIELTDEVVDLARLYIEEKVVGKTSLMIACILRLLQYRRLTFW